MITNKILVPAESRTGDSARAVNKIRRLNRNIIRTLLLVLSIFLFDCSQKTDSIAIQDEQTHQIPHLKKQGSTTQLIVAGKPFIVLGGELGN